MLVRDGMLSDPVALSADASAQEAAEHLVRPDVRAVLVVDANDVLVGVVTPDALVEKVVATGSDPRSTPLADAAVPPPLVLDADLPLEEGYRLLEEAEAERALGRPATACRGRAARGPQQHVKAPGGASPSAGAASSAAASATPCRRSCPLTSISSSP